MVSVILFTTVQLCLVLIGQGKTFTRCELAKELLKQGFPRDQLPNWVCLVESESSRRTEVVGPPNTDGSRDHGLFQINDRYWCKNGPKRGKECNVRCNGRWKLEGCAKRPRTKWGQWVEAWDCRFIIRDVQKDDIKIASQCAKKIFGASNFSAWMGWLHKCQGKPLPDLTPCSL